MDKFDSIVADIGAEKTAELSEIANFRATFVFNLEQFEAIETVLTSFVRTFQNDPDPEFQRIIAILGTVSGARTE